MVGNPLQSDIKIVAKNGETFFAHSFMLAARFGVLAKVKLLLYNHLVRLRYVMAYISTYCNKGKTIFASQNRPFITLRYKCALLAFLLLRWAVVMIIKFYSQMLKDELLTFCAVTREFTTKLQHTRNCFLVCRI